MNSTLHLILVFLLSSAIGTEVFGVAFLNGFLKDLKAKRILFTAFTISLINASMSMLGFLVGFGMNLLLGNFSKTLSAAIVLLISMKILVKSFKPKFQEMTWELHKTNVLAGFALAIGINSFLAGIVLSSLGASWLFVFGVFLATFFFATLTGIVAGRNSKNFFVAARTGIAGGTMLLAGAIVFILNLFGIINF